MMPAIDLEQSLWMTKPPRFEGGTFANFGPGGGHLPTNALMCNPPIHRVRASRVLKRILVLLIRSEEQR